MGATEKQLSLLCSEASFSTAHCREERPKCERVANRGATRSLPGCPTTSRPSGVALGGPAQTCC